MRRENKRIVKRNQHKMLKEILAGKSELCRYLITLSIHFIRRQKKLFFVLLINAHYKSIICCVFCVNLCHFGLPVDYRSTISHCFDTKDTQSNVFGTQCSTKSSKTIIILSPSVRDSKRR